MLDVNHRRIDISRVDRSTPYVVASFSTVQGSAFGEKTDGSLRRKTKGVNRLPNTTESDDLPQSSSSSITCLAGVVTNELWLPDDSFHRTQIDYALCFRCCHLLHGANPVLNAQKCPSAVNCVTSGLPLVRTGCLVGLVGHAREFTQPLVDEIEQLDRIDAHLSQSSKGISSNTWCPMPMPAEFKSTSIGPTSAWIFSKTEIH